MTLTFLDLYNECAGQPWSMFDADAESIEDLESALKISINKAASFLWNYQPWNFRINKTKIKTKADRKMYSLPDGIILKKSVNNSEKHTITYNGTYLDYLPDYELLEEQTGEPVGFYIDGDFIYIYPTPDDSYQINIRYILQPFGMNTDEEELHELKEETDYINISEKYETLFKNCVISLAMMYAIADESDENYSGYQKQYEDALNTLEKYCLDNISEKHIVW